MNHFEMAELLRFKGHDVYSNKKGFMFEAFLLEQNPKPINFDELYRIAESLGYVYDEQDGWIERKYVKTYFKKELCCNGI